MSQCRRIPRKWAVKVLPGLSQTRVNDVPLDAKTKTLAIPRRVPAPELVTAERPPRVVRFTAHDKRVISAPSFR